MVVIAVVLGIVAAVIGFIPLAIAIKKARRMSPSDGMSQLGRFLLTIFVSFVILAAALIACAKLAHDVSLPFAGAEIIAFIVIVIAYGLVTRRGNK